MSNRRATPIDERRVIILRGDVTAVPRFALEAAVEVKVVGGQRITTVTFPSHAETISLAAEGPTVFGSVPAEIYGEQPAGEPGDIWYSAYGVCPFCGHKRHVERRGDSHFMCTLCRMNREARD